MRGFWTAVAVGLGIVFAGTLVLRALGADEGFYFALAVFAMFAGSLVDREGFYGDPHPFARRPR